MRKRLYIFLLALISFQIPVFASIRISVPYIFDSSNSKQEILGVLITTGVLCLFNTSRLYTSGKDNRDSNKGKNFLYRAIFDFFYQNVFISVPFFILHWLFSSIFMVGLAGLFIKLWTTISRFTLAQNFILSQNIHLLFIATGVIGILISRLIPEYIFKDDLISD